MKCKHCNIEMMIDHSDYFATGDDSPDTPTRLYTALYFACRNPACPEKGVLIKGERIPLGNLPAVQADRSTPTA